MEDVKLKMQERQKLLTDEFDTLTKEATALVDQWKIINKRLSEIAARKWHIQWAYSEITGLLDKPVSIEEEAKKKQDKPKK